MIIVYCEVDDWLKDKQLRRRGPDPTLSDSEVLTMEIVGESPKAWAMIPKKVSIATFVIP